MEQGILCVCLSKQSLPSAGEGAALFLNSTAMWPVFCKVSRTPQILNQDEEVTHSHGPGSTRYADFLMHGQMDCVFTESAPLPVPGQGKISSRLLLLPGFVPVSRPASPQHLFPLFVDHWRAKLERKRERD